jgi:hypothetical protein
MCKVNTPWWQYLTTSRLSGHFEQVKSKRKRKESIKRRMKELERVRSKREAEAERGFVWERNSGAHDYFYDSVGSAL